MLNLTPHQVRQAEAQRKAADDTVDARQSETYQWLLVPAQPAPQAAGGRQAIRRTRDDLLAAQASKEPRNDELLVAGFAGTRLRMEWDRIPLWRGDHVAMRQLVDHSARSVFLPRLAGSDMLFGAATDGLSVVTRADDTCAYADTCDGEAGRFCGMREDQAAPIAGHDQRGLLVKAEAALHKVTPRE